MTKLYNNEWEYAVEQIAKTIHELEMYDPLMKMKLLYTFAKIYQTEEHLDNVCLVLDRNNNEKKHIL